MGFAAKNQSRAARSGGLAEEFCKRKFGIVEDSRYEIKSSSWRNGQIVVRTCQLMDSLEKQYVVVRYKREMRTLKRGPRKGTRVFEETIEQAYQKPLWVFVIRGVEIARIIAANRLPLRMTVYEKDGRWAPYWCVRIKYLPDEVMFQDSEVTLHGDALDPPGWLNDSQDEVPF